LSENVQKKLVEKLIAMVESGGTLPWQKPWDVEGHRNLVSKKAYRGFNAMLLPFVADSMGWKSSWWLSYKQAKSLGGQVRKGESGTPVAFYKPFKVEEKVDGEIKESFRYVLRYYIIFNADQVDGIEKKIPAKTERVVDSVESAEKIIADYPASPKVEFGCNAAYYMQKDDLVGMPEKNSFHGTSEYYATFFHELVHSTGHENRLARKTLTDYDGFGGNNYSKEELVAEIGATMLCSKAGIEPPIDNSAAYLAGWLKKIKEDSGLLIWAAAQAQKACDHVNNVSWEAK